MGLPSGSYVMFLLYVGRPLAGLGLGWVFWAVTGGALGPFAPSPCLLCRRGVNASAAAHLRDTLMGPPVLRNRRASPPSCGPPVGPPPEGVLL